MEYTLRVQFKPLTDTETKICLNPCYNGIYSKSYGNNQEQQLQQLVLILVIMEYTLRVINNNINSQAKVLILVIMEYTLRVIKYI